MSIRVRGLGGLGLTLSLGLGIAGCYQNPDPFDAERQQSLAGGQSAASRGSDQRNEDTLLDRQREAQQRQAEEQQRSAARQDPVQPAGPESATEAVNDQVPADAQAARQAARRSAAAAARSIPRPVSVPQVQLPGSLLGR